MSSFSKSGSHEQAPPSTSHESEASHGPRSASLAKAGAAALGRIIESGDASYYGTSTHAQMLATGVGDGFIGQTQADGTPLVATAMTAAHKALPLGTKVEVVVHSTGKRAEVTITDRGPYEPGRILDGTVAVAEKLGYKEAGFTAVTLHEVKK